MNNSADFSPPAELNPPTTSTLPLGSSVVVWEVRTVVILPVSLNPCEKTWIVKACGVALRPAESVTSIEMGNDPVVEGVPERRPLAAKTSPGGSVPVSVQLSGKMPFCALKVKL